MPEPEQDWVGRAIPPVPGWAVHPVWHGLFTHATYASAAECFAANRTCRQDLVRQPVAHRNAVTQPDTGPVRADINAGHPARHRSDAHQGADPNAGAGRGDAAGGAGNSNSGRHAHHLRADNGDPRNAGGVLLDVRAADAEPDADAATVRDAGAGYAMSQGRVSHDD